MLQGIKQLQCSSELTDDLIFMAINTEESASGQ